MENEIKNALECIFCGIEKLQKVCSDRRKFTIDGRLVGDIGEIIAERNFDIELDKISRPKHDAKTTDGRDVQIKATFGESLTFRETPTLYLGIKLYRNGSHEVIFNGPGSVIFEYYKHRKGIGEKLLSFPVSRLRQLSENLDEQVPAKTTK